MKWIVVLLMILSSCYVGMTVDERRAKQRLRDSERMYREVHRVRKKCVPRMKRVGRPHRHVYYS